MLSGAPPFLAMAAFGTVGPGLVITSLAGFTGGVLHPIVGAVSCERIPRQLLARVLGAAKASAWVGIPFGSLLGGALVTGTGLTTALVVCGAVMLGRRCRRWFSLVWRRLDRNR